MIYIKSADRSAIILKQINSKKALKMRELYRSENFRVFE